MEKLKLFIFQAPRTVHVTWEDPPPGKLTNQQWKSYGYYHPDVEVHIARAGCLSRFNHNLIGYHIMLALQDANMPVNALRRECANRRKTKSETLGYAQGEFWPSE